MEYSAVIQPPATFCSFIQRGTVSSTVTPQITRVLPHSIKVDPVAYGATPFWNRIGRNWSGFRPSGRAVWDGAVIVMAGILPGAASSGNGNHFGNGTRKNSV